MTTLAHVEWAGGEVISPSPSGRGGGGKLVKGGWQIPGSGVNTSVSWQGELPTTRRVADEARRVADEARRVADEARRVADEARRVADEARRVKTIPS